MRLIAGLLVLSMVGATAAETMLWYDKPAKSWETEALPIGNGHLGAMLFGGPAKDRIQFNEGSLWIGDETDTGAYQAFGDVFIEVGTSARVPVTGYRRELDLERAIHTVTYESEGVRY